MGRLARLLAVLTTIKNGVSVPESKVELTKGENSIMEQYGPPGDDSRPIAGDLVYTSTKEGTGSRVALGYIDQVNAPTAQEGEKRLYSRDSAGVPIATIWLKNDGTIEMGNTVEASLLTLMEDLIQAVQDIKTFGSPTNHQLDPDSITALESVKTRFGDLFD